MRMLSQNFKIHSKITLSTFESICSYCRKKEKTNKIKKNELAGSLGKALIKVSEQQ